MFHDGRNKGDLAIGMEMAFDTRLNEQILARASELVVDAEPILGCRLIADVPVPHWQELPAAERRVFTATKASHEHDDVWQAGLESTKSPQIAVRLWHREAGDSLLIRMTHQVGDGAALQYVASRLSGIYSALCTDGSYRPQASAPTDRDLTSVLSHVPTREYPRVIWDFVRFMAPRLHPRRTLGLPLPDDSSGPWRRVMRRLAPASVTQLAAYGKARGATLNDMFLAAAYRALASCGRWDGKAGLRILITVNLRRWCGPKEYTGPICNLSSFELPFLIRNLGRDFEQTLANVRALTAARKKSRPGLAPALVSRFRSKCQALTAPMTGGAGEHGRQQDLDRGLAFSNEGALHMPSLRFGPHTPRAAHVVPPFFVLPWLHFTLSGYNGSLTLLAVTPQNGCEIVEGFFTALLDELPGQSTEEHHPSQASDAAGSRRDRDVVMAD
jgi:NRPS condensation-like uncharacterized protein